MFGPCNQFRLVFTEQLLPLGRLGAEDTCILTSVQPKQIHLHFSLLLPGCTLAIQQKLYLIASYYLSLFLQRTNPALFGHTSDVLQHNGKTSFPDTAYVSFSEYDTSQRLGCGLPLVGVGSQNTMARVFQFLEVRSKLSCPT